MSGNHYYLISLMDNRSVIACTDLCESAIIPGTIAIEGKDFLELIDAKCPIEDERAVKPSSKVQKIRIPLHYIKYISQFEGTYVPKAKEAASK